MKNEYLVLWIDDDLGSVESDMSKLTRYLGNVGIKVILQQHEDSDDVDIHELIKPTLQNPELDLIVVDYNMPGVKGDVLISQIRETDHVYLPVVFYSGVSVDQLMDYAKDKGIDGVYFAHRDNLNTRLEQIVDSLLNKEKTVKRTRGLLMEGVSEIDSKLKDAASLLWTKLTVAQQDKITSDFKVVLNDKKKSAEKTFASAPTTKEAMKELIDNTLLSSSYDTMIRWKLVKEMLKASGLNATELAIFKEFYFRGDTEKPLGDKRNIYAHKTREALLPDHTPEAQYYIRTELRRQSENLDKMLADLRAPAKA